MQTCTYKNLTIEKKENVGIITIFNPPENRFFLSMLKEMRKAFAQLDMDEGVRLIMLKSKGETFCTGGDVRAILDSTDWAGTEFFLNVSETGKAIRNTVKPTLAVVDGWATAGGGIMATACDMVIASDKARFGATAIHFGLLCFFGPAVLLPAVGIKKAFEYCITGDLIMPEEAEQRGMINKVVPADQLEEAAWEMARKITAKSPSAVMLGKRCLKTCIGLDIDKAMSHGAACMVQYQMTAEAQEGMTAYLENREANFQIESVQGDYSIKRKA